MNPFSITSGRRRLYCDLRPKGVFLEAMPKAGGLPAGEPRVAGFPVDVPRVAGFLVDVPRAGEPLAGGVSAGEVWVDELPVGAPLADERQADADDKSDNCPRKGVHQCKRPAVCRNTAL